MTSAYGSTVSHLSLRLHCQPCWCQRPTLSASERNVRSEITAALGSIHNCDLDGDSAAILVKRCILGSFSPGVSLKDVNAVSDLASRFRVHVVSCTKTDTGGESHRALEGYEGFQSTPTPLRGGAHTQRASPAAVGA